MPGDDWESLLFFMVVICGVSNFALVDDTMKMNYGELIGGKEVGGLVHTRASMIVLWQHLWCHR